MKSFIDTYEGFLQGVLQWEEWDALRQRVGASRVPWYVYAIGHPLPEQPLSGAALEGTLAEIDALLHRDHEEPYLGIVYVDDVQEPTLLKIYDPNNLGVSCGSSGYRIPPGWVISIEPPVTIASDAPLPNNRRRWWQTLRERFTHATSGSEN